MWCPYRPPARIGYTGGLLATQLWTQVVRASRVCASFMGCLNYFDPGTLELE
jgi:hypothetical protein